MDIPEIFHRTRLLTGDDAMNRILRTRVIVFGAGGVGSWCAEALVRTGVGRIDIVDPDVVCASNVNRQLMATSLTIGEAKVEVFRRRLLEINPKAQIVSRREAFRADTADAFCLDEYDFAIDAIDSLADKMLLIRRALDVSGLVLFSSMGAARRLDPTRVRSTAFTKVQGDGLARALRSRFRRDGGIPQRPFTCVWSDEPQLPANTQCRENGSAVPVTAAFGLALASLVIRTVVEGRRG